MAIMGKKKVKKIVTTKTTFASAMHTMTLFANEIHFQFYDAISNKNQKTKK